MILIARAEARAAGLDRYFTGKPCKFGHTVERYVSNGECVICSQSRNARWMAENAEQRREWTVTHRQENADKIREMKKAWRDKNREHVRITDRQRGSRHKEKVLERALAWQRDNPDGVRARAARRRARKAGSSGNYTTVDIKVILKLQRGRCAYCRTRVGRAFHVDHIVPLFRGGSNDRTNIQICCSKCNSGKSARDPIEYARTTGRLL